MLVPLVQFPPTLTLAAEIQLSLTGACGAGPNSIHTFPSTVAK